MDDLLNIIIQLQSTQSGVFLKLIKDNDSPIMPDASVRLDPNTFLVIK
jgi:hypothetical protein